MAISIDCERVVMDGGYSAEAINVLARLGVCFREGDFRDIYRITSRDTQGGSYPYNAGFSRFGQERNNWIIVQQGIETGFYYTGLWRDRESKKMLGEVGMVHLAPAIRGKGLSSLVTLLGNMQSLEGGAAVLRVTEGDETGKVACLMDKFGFLGGDRTVGPLKHPLWTMTVSGASERMERLEMFRRHFLARAERMRKEDLSFNPASVDIDNPSCVSIQGTVCRRLLDGIDWDKAGEKLLFGYVHAPVFIYGVSHGRRASVLALRALNQGKADQSILRESIRNNLLCPDPVLYEIGREVEFDTPLLKSGDEVKQAALGLARAGEEFFHTAVNTV